MSLIGLPAGLPGILALFAFRPETAGPLKALAETLLRGPSTLTPGERELIAAFVSHRNGCRFCCDSHSAYAAAQLDGGHAVVDAVRLDYRAAPVSDKMKALLVVAAQVRESGRVVNAESVNAARAAGASDVEIHDTVLIAAAFCMFNRYVDGLGTPLPVDPGVYDARAQHIATQGYTR